MRNQKGVTMISLVIYIVSFAIIIGIVGAVTTFFSNNVSGLNEIAGKNAEYNKFNIYMSDYTQNGYQVTIGDYGENSNPYILFEKNDEQIVFEKIDDILYMNNVKLCDKVEEFETVLSITENGQNVLKTKIKINGTVFTNDYVLGNKQVSDLEEEIDNSESLVLGLVDDLGTHSTIYLYNNTDKITSGSITITMPDSTTSTITALADTSSISSTANYATYTVAKNGTYEFQATDGTNTTTTKIKIKNIEQFTDVSTLGLSYAKNEQKAYNYNGAAVPKGYYVDTKSKVSTGLVITDSIDAEGYSIGNEWVWVPVNESIGNKDFYLTGSGTVAGTSVQYSKYSKLFSFVDKTREPYGTFHPSGLAAETPTTPSSESGIREPAILTADTYGEAANLEFIKQRGSENKFTNVNDIATQYVTDFNNMCDSVDKYDGFFIGRYELTANGEKAGKTLVDKSWYEFYNQCMTYGKTNTESGMMYGSLWDDMMQWFAKLGYSVGYTQNLTCGYGNLKTEEVFVKDNFVNIIVKEKDTSLKLSTGQTSYTKVNNIYDLLGNIYEFTQEASNDTYRILRGDNYYSATLDNTFVADRNSIYPNASTAHSSRPCLYIK